MGETEKTATSVPIEDNGTIGAIEYNYHEVVPKSYIQSRSGSNSFLKLCLKNVFLKLLHQSPVVSDTSKAFSLVAPYTFILMSRRQSLRHGAT